MSVLDAVGSLFRPRWRARATTARSLVPATTTGIDCSLQLDAALREQSCRLGLERQRGVYRATGEHRRQYRCHHDGRTTRNAPEPRPVAHRSALPQAGALPTRAEDVPARDRRTVPGCRGIPDIIAAFRPKAPGPRRELRERFRES